MNGDDGLGSRGESGGGSSRVEVGGDGITVGTDGGGPYRADGHPGGDERVRRDDDLVAGADVRSAQDELQGVESVRATDAMGDFWPEDEVAALKHARVSGVERFAQWGVLRRQVVEGNPHRWAKAVCRKSPKSRK